MNIIVEIQHPAHIHHFKNMIWDLEKKGHNIQICTTDKDVSLSLLDNYGFKYEILGINKGKSLLLGKIPLLIKFEWKMYKIAKKFRPDLFISRGSPISAHISALFHKPYIISSDSEPVALGRILSFPFANAIYIPSSFRKEIKNDKIIKIDGYKEMAYLHPNYFKPDPSVLAELGLDSNDEYVVIRFVSLKAYHDVGIKGIQNKIEFVQKLSKYTTVYISSEEPLPYELSDFKLPTKSTRIHDVLYYAKMLVCDSQTMTTEAAILGTPVIRCNSFVGENDMGNFIELEEKYGLIFNYKKTDDALNKAIELVQRDDLKEEWKHKRNRLLDDKIDVTKFMIWFVENYPLSFKRIKQNPEIQYQFK